MYKVRKRNGNLESFNITRIENAITKAFKSSNVAINNDIIKKISKEINIWDEITVEDIQDQIVELLEDYGYSNVAILYKSYKDKQSRARMLWSKIKYMDDYINSSENAASISNTDGNANSSAKNVATLEPEVFKDDFRTIQRYRMKRKLKQMYPEVAYNYEQDIEGHEIYIHDEASTPTLKQYCMAVSLYPLMLEGCGVLDKTTPSKPNDLQSFSGQLVNSIFTLSAQCKGAVACLHGSQKLLINGKPVRIKDFVNSNWGTSTKYEDWEYCDISNENYKVLEDGKYVKINKVFRKKYSDKILTITSNNGYTAKVSKDHKFKVFENAKIKEVEAKNLKVFDTVFVNPEIPIDFTSSSYKEGWIKGMLLGDGCLIQPDMVQLSINYDQEYYADLFNEYCSEIYDDTLYQCKGNKCFQYETHKKDFSSRLKEGISGTNAFDKNINIDNNIEYLVGVLDGLLCADGGDYHSIGISLVNKNLTNTVMNILNILNIKYSYKSIPAHDNKSELFHLNISTKVLNYTSNLLLKLNNKRYNFTYYHSGFANTKSRINPEFILSNKKGHFKYPVYKTDVITSITSEDNDDEYVYEIETETHWYNCGGFITHNCGSYFIALNYYIIAEYGKEWYKHLDEEVTSSICSHPRTMQNMIEKAFKQFVCGINQPAGNRGYQSPFTNISYYDKTYFNSLFGSFYYPDDTQPQWEAIDTLQRLFMKWFNKWRLKQLVAFPVETMAMVYDPETKDIIDKQYKLLTAQMYAEGHSFFTYISDNADSLASCCRLRNELAENTFNPTSGLTGIKTGSCNVITLNINRILQNYCKPYSRIEVIKQKLWDNPNYKQGFVDYLIQILERVYKYHITYKTMLYEWEEKGAYASSNGGFINIKDLYSTIGINGLKVLGLIA